LSTPENAPRVLIPVLPGIQGWRRAEKQRGDTSFLPLGFCALAIERQAGDKESAGESDSPTLPPGDFLPPVLLAVAARGIHDLIAAAPTRAKPAFPRIAKALRGSRPEAALWQRRGPYLLPKRPVEGNEWAAMFRRFLEAGFLLPPTPFHPAILPGILSPGEEAKLADLLRMPLD